MHALTVGPKKIFHHEEVTSREDSVHRRRGRVLEDTVGRLHTK